jgi:hypothetical protein
MLDLDRAAAESQDGIPVEPIEAEDSKTGEFAAVAPGSSVVSNTPALEDLLDLADRQGEKR